MRILFTALVALSIWSVSASANKEVGNGGDICEDRIRTIAADIVAWLRDGGAADLKLPGNLSVSQFEEKMLGALGSATVSCTDSSITVSGSEKTCKNYYDLNGKAKILCNRNRFKTETESDQYVLVHHEYAGLANFETNEGPSSNYEISNQISGYLVDQVVKRLSVRKAPQTDACSRPVVFKTINRCDSVRTHGGDAGNDESLSYKGNVYEIGAAPQTFEQLYSIICESACGGKIELLRAIEWDCVGNQDVASFGRVHLPYQYVVPSRRACDDTDDETARTVDYYFYSVSRAAKLTGVKPPGMPPSQSGIEYWAGQ